MSGIPVASQPRRPLSSVAFSRLALALSGAFGGLGAGAGEGQVQTAEVLVTDSSLPPC